MSDTSTAIAASDLEQVYLDAYAGPADPRGAWSWVTLRIERPGKSPEYVTFSRSSSAAAEWPARAKGRSLTRLFGGRAG